MFGVGKKIADIASGLCLLAHYENTARLLWRILHVRFNTRNTFKYSTFGVLETIVFNEKNNPKFVVFSMNAERALLTTLDKKGESISKKSIGGLHTGLRRTNCKLYFVVI